MATKAVRIPSAAASFLGVSEQLFLQQRCTYKEERVARTRHGRSMVKHYFEVMYPPPPNGGSVPTSSHFTYYITLVSYKAPWVHHTSGRQSKRVLSRSI